MTRLLILAILLSGCATTRPGDFSRDQLAALPALLRVNSN